MIDVILKSAGAKAEKDGFQVLPDGASLTLYAERNGATLSVPRVEAVKVDGQYAYARTQKRELFVLVVADIFAGASEGSSGQPQRRAGFG
jgi:hypothetical protein